MLGGWNGTAEKTFNDIYIFSIDEQNWSKQPTSGRGVAPLYGHSATLLNDNQLFVYGGNWKDENAAGGFAMSSEMRVLDTDTWVWSRFVQRGDLVPPRYGHTTLAVGSHLIVFGGWAGLNRAVRTVKSDSTSVSASQTISGVSSQASQQVAAPAEVYAYDTEKHEWSSPLIAGHCPTSRYYHSATMVGTKICFFAGCDNANPKNDFHVLETKTEIFEEVDEWGEGGEGQQ